MARKQLQLGRRSPIPDSPNKAVLDRVPNPHVGTNYVARFTAPEFTTLCPITGQPDFAHLVIDYVPAKFLVESKSLKLYLNSYRNHAREAHPTLFEPSFVCSINLVAVPMALRYLRRTINLRHAAAAREHRIVSAKTHCAAEIAARAALLQLVTLEPFRHQPDDGFGRCAELCRVGTLDAAQIARCFKYGHLHPETDAEVWNVPLARELRRSDLSFRATLAEPARHQDAVDVLEKRRRVLAFENLGLDPVEIDLHFIGNSAVGERLDQ